MMMSMLNQAAVEALCSATYLENYLSCMENLPDDLQRVVSQLRELDVVMNDIISDIQIHQEVYVKENDGNKKQRALVQIQRGLIRSQEIGDEKLQLVSHVIEHIDSRARQLEQDLENLDPAAAAGLSEDVKPKVSTPTNTAIQSTTSRSKAVEANSTPAVVKTEEKQENTPLSAKNKRARRQRGQVELPKEEKKDEEEQKPPKKKKKRKVKQKAGACVSEKAGDKSPLDFQDIDPDEPTYCLCEQVSYGEMIGCDNDSCPIEWFHFNCVQLVHKPKGKWYCPKCRGDKPTVKRPDLR